MNKTIEVQTIVRPSFIFIDGKIYWRSITFTPKVNVNIYDDIYSGKKNISLIDYIGKYETLTLYIENRNNIDIDYYIDYYDFHNAHIALTHSCCIKDPVFVVVFDSVTFRSEDKNLDQSIVFDANLARKKLETRIPKERLVLIENLFNQCIIGIQSLCNSVDFYEIKISNIINQTNTLLAETSYLRNLFIQRGFEVSQPYHTDNSCDYWIKVTW